MELRENGNSFEPDRERPEKISEGPVSVDKEGSNQSAWDKELPMFKTITQGIITDAVRLFKSHQIYDISGGTDEQKLHGKEIESLVTESVEKIKISCAENDKIEFLSFARQTKTIL